MSGQQGPDTELCPRTRTRQTTKRDRYLENLRGEIDGASLYRALAEAEPDPKLAEVYGRLAAVEDSHAEYWKRQLAKLGAHTRGLKPGFRSRGLAFLARRFGPSFCATRDQRARARR